MALKTKNIVLLAGLAGAGYYLYTSSNAAGTSIFSGSEKVSEGIEGADETGLGDYNLNFPQQDYSGLFPPSSLIGGQTKKEATLSPSSSSSSSSTGGNSNKNPSNMSTEEKQQKQGEIMKSIIEAPAASHNPLEAAQQRTDSYNQLNALGAVASKKSYEEVFKDVKNLPSDPIDSKKAVISGVNPSRIMSEEQLIALTSNNPKSISAFTTVIPAPSGIPITAEQPKLTDNKILNAIISPLTLDFSKIIPSANASPDSGKSGSNKIAKTNTAAIKAETEKKQGETMTTILNTPAASINPFEAAQQRTDLYAQLGATGAVSSNKSYNEVFAAVKNLPSDTTKKAASSTPAPASAPVATKKEISIAKPSTADLRNAAAAKREAADKAAAAAKKKK